VNRVASSIAIPKVDKNAFGTRWRRRLCGPRLSVFVSIENNITLTRFVQMVGWRVALILSGLI